MQHAPVVLYVTSHTPEAVASTVSSSRGVAGLLHYESCTGSLAVIVDCGMSSLSRTTQPPLHSPVSRSHYVWLSPGHVHVALVLTTRNSYISRSLPNITPCRGRAGCLPFHSGAHPNQALLDEIYASKSRNAPLGVQVRFEVARGVSTCLTAQPEGGPALG